MVGSASLNYKYFILSYFFEKASTSGRFKIGIGLKEV